MHRNIIIFGCGNTLNEYIDFIEQYCNILFLCDNDEMKWGTSISTSKKEYTVHQPQILNEYLDTPIYIISIYWQEILKQLHEIGCTKICCPYAEQPLSGDLPYANILYEHIQKDPQKMFGNREDVDLKAYWAMVYSGWNNHYQMHFMLTRISELGYLKEKSTILDYGCGVGTLGLSALLRGYDCYGIDLNTWKHSVLQRKITELHYPEEWKNHFMVYDGNELPFENGCFDVVTTYQVLEHVSDVYSSVKEILRVCKDEGIAYLHCPNYDRSYEEHYLIDLQKPLHGHKEEFKRFVGSYGADVDEVDHINFINKDDIKHVITDIGNYEIIDLLEADPLSDIDFIVMKR